MSPLSLYSTLRHCHWGAARRAVRTNPLGTEERPKQAFSKRLLFTGSGDTAHGPGRMLSAPTIFPLHSPGSIARAEVPLTAEVRARAQRRRRWLQRGARDVAVAVVVVCRAPLLGRCATRAHAAAAGALGLPANVGEIVSVACACPAPRRFGGVGHVGAARRRRLASRGRGRARGRPRAWRRAEAVAAAAAARIAAVDVRVENLTAHHAENGGERHAIGRLFHLSQAGR